MKQVKKDNVEVVYGGRAIGEVIDEPDLHTVYYRLSHNYIPGATKLGNRWVLSLPVWRKAMHNEQ